MIDLNLNNTLIELVKIGAVIFALLHVFAGFIIVRQVTRISKMINTSNNSFFRLVGILYMILLIGVLLGVALI